MFRKILISATLLALLAWTRVCAAAPDYIDELTRLSQLASDGQYQQAIEGYQALQAQAGTPNWLRAASEFEIADLHGALHETDKAIASLGRSVQLGYDDCLTPRTSEHLAGMLKNPQAAQALAGMKISEADLRELAWLQREVENAGHDAQLMITDNINRVDQQATEIPQASLPTRPTTSPAVLYWRQQLLLMQRAQREFVKNSDEERMVHAATMGIVSGSSSSAALESAQLAHAAAESRRAEIRKRAFVLPASASGQAKSCSELTGIAR
jgi:hypothetical protein